MNETEIKEACEFAVTLTESEIEILTKDKERRKDMRLVVYGVIDHIYTALGFGDYQKYLNEAGVIRDE